MRNLISFILILAGLIVIFTIPVFADQPPDPGGGPGTGGNPVGGGSPLGGGLITLLVAGTIYGINKVRNIKR